MVDYCNEWLKQYRASYDVMDRICSSTKGNRYTLSVVTDVILCQDDDGDFYHFSLNMFNGAGEYFFEGPSLDISVNNIAMVGYLVSSIVDCYTKNMDVNCFLIFLERSLFLCQVIYLPILLLVRH